MKRLLGIVALLATGCAPPPVAPATALAIAPVPELRDHVSSASAPAEAIATSSAPQSGTWELSYAFGQGPMRTQRLQLRFEEDHRVTVEGGIPGAGDYPFRWDDQRTSFEGLPRRDMAGGSAVSRDRLALTVVSPIEMRGTLSLRANLRWYPIPVTARLVSQSADWRLAPGTIIDTDASERID